MNNLVIPPSPNWYESRIMACATDNTLVYGSMNEIVIIHPVDTTKEAKIKVIPYAHYSDRVISVDTNLNWGPATKLVVSGGDDKVIHVWDIEKYSLMTSNSVHTTQADKFVGSCFLGTDKVVSASENGFVSLWRFNSNETTTFKNLFPFKVRISTLSACPHASWLVAFGLHCGVLVIVDLRKEGRVIYKLRAHDAAVVSLAWCPTPFNIFPKKVTEGRKLPQNPQKYMNGSKSSTSDESNNTAAKIPEVSVEKCEHKKKSNPWVGLKHIDDDEHDNDELPRKTPSPVDDFLAQCLKLKKDMSTTKDEKKEEEVIEVDMKEEGVERRVLRAKRKEKKGVDGIADAEEAANIAVEGAVDQNKRGDLETELMNVENFGEEGSKSTLQLPCANNQQVSSDTELDHEVEGIFQPTKEYLLASSSRGRSICIWRAGTDGRKQIELSLPSKRYDKRSKRPDKSWISLCWLTPEILLSSSSGAELLQWDLLCMTDKGNVPKKKQIHHDHNNNLFAIVAPMTLLPEWEDKNLRSRKDLAAWTTGQERYILNTSLGADRKTLESYPTNGGHIYTLTSSPLDPSRVAIGIGDHTMKVWDLSKPHTDRIVMLNVWKKVQNKVLTLAWHPGKETCLAYATFEGRIGTINTNQAKAPTLLNQYFRSAVYLIEWGPLNGDKGTFGLYACGEGSLVVYDTEKESDPKVIETPPQEYIHCIAWKSDYSQVACGSKTGAVILYDINFKHLTTIYSQYKSIYSLVWHPLATLQDDGVSQYSSWLALSASSNSVVVFDTSLESNKDDDVDKRIVAVLNGHTKPVRCICWNQYIGGMIVSGGDDGVVFVWDVNTKSVLSTFIEHKFEPVLAVLWSPLDPNYIISGGKDNCIRVWNIKEHAPIADTELLKLQRLNSNQRLTKKKQHKKEKEQADDDANPKVKRDFVLNLTARAQNNNNTEAVLKDSIRLFENLTLSSETTPQENNEELSFDVLKIFGTKDEVYELLDAEKKNHSEKMHFTSNQHIDLYKGDIADMIKTAIKQGNVNPWIIGLAPMVSPKLWQEACEVYAKKLVEDPKTDPFEAVSYLLACHKVGDAIDVLCKATLYREAMVLAKCRLAKSDPTVEDILRKWATFGVINGSYEISAQCFIVLGMYEEAAKALFKRSNLDALKFAITLAEKSGNEDLIKSCRVRFNSFNVVSNDEVSPKDAQDAVLKLTEDVENLELTEDTVPKLTENTMTEATKDTTIKVTEDKKTNVTEDAAVKITIDSIADSVDIKNVPMIDEKGDRLDIVEIIEINDDYIQ